MPAFFSHEVFLELNLLEILLASFVIICGASLQASAGFGSGLVAVPLLGIIEPRFLPGPLLFAYLFLCSFMCWQERRFINFFTQKYLVFGLSFGTLTSLIILSFISVNYFPIIAALFVLTGVGFSLFQKNIPLKKQNLFIGGSISGVMSTLAGLSGPPMALILQFQKPEFIRANLACAFIFASLLSISALFYKNIFIFSDTYLGLCLVPGMFIGFLFGKKLTHFLDPKKSRLAILTLSSLSAISLLVKSI